MATGLGILLKKVSPRLFKRLTQHFTLRQIRNDIIISETVCEDKEGIQYIVLNSHNGEAVRVMSALGGISEILFKR